jgi:predicted alpha/beta hydrolase family esterase
MKEDIVIFHGLGCNGESVWIPWLVKKLKTEGHRVWTPSLPNTTNPRAEEWVSAAEGVLAQTDQPLILIGHSLGGTLILHLLSRKAEWQSRLKHAYLFGSPAFTRPYTPEFYNEPFDWPSIKEHSSKITAVWSRDDDRVPEDHIREIESNIDAQIEIVNGHGHFRELTNIWLEHELA